MAIETITIKDADGVERQISADAIDGAFAQVFKLAWGADGVLTLAESASPLPVTLPPAATPHYDAAGTADVDLTTVAGRLMSFSARETTEVDGARAVFLLRDGTGGTVVAIVTLGSGESVRDTFAPNGIALTSGLRLDRVSGTSEVSAAVA